MSSGEDAERLKQLLLELLRRDREFRRVVAAELGLLEILERLEGVGRRLEEHTRVIRELLERIAGLEERVVKLEEAILEHTKALRLLEERVTKLEERFAKLEERFLKLEERVARLEERVTKLEERFARLEERVAKLEERFAELEERVVKLEERLLRVEERLEEHSRAIRALQEQMLKLQEAILEHSRAIRALQERFEMFENRLAALGARWGLYAEEAVREALYRILQGYLGVARVEKWRVYDESGVVFGRPSVVEIDVVVKDDTHYLIEVKSNIDLYDVYMFERKCRFYAERVKPPKTRKLIVTFYADERAAEAARELGVEIVKG